MCMKVIRQWKKCPDLNSESVVLFGSQHMYPDSDWSAAVGVGPQRGAPAAIPAVPDLHGQAGLLPLHLLHAHRLSEGQPHRDKLSYLHSHVIT